MAKSATLALKKVNLINVVNVLGEEVIIILVSFVENMLLTFLRCFFYNNPQQMYDFLGDKKGDGIKGKIDLKDVVQSRSKENLLIKLADRAATSAMQGDFKSIIKRIKRLLGDEKELNSLLDETIKIVECRNRIVHELSDEEIKIEQVENSFITVYSLLNKLQIIGLDMLIDVEATYEIRELRGL